MSRPAMRPLISWADLATERVAVWGLGREGRASLRRLRSLGVEPVVVDDNTVDDAVDGVRAHKTADDGYAVLMASSVVVKTPGISRYRPEVTALEAAGIPVVGGLGLWLAGADRHRVVCVTGTKGKSTTTSVLAHLAGGLGYRAFAGGNLGAPPWDPDAPDDADLWVIETSSYQATDVAVSPPLVVVTSLSPDHLPWHGDVGRYFADKLSLCSQPGARLTVASSASAALVAQRPRLGPAVRWVDEGAWADRRWAEPLGLLGEHNLVNASLARACLEELGLRGATDAGVLREAAAGYQPLPSRLQRVGTVDGVEFVDDSLSTNVLPTIAALATFPGRRIALIAGGLDRDIDYHPLAEAVARRAEPTLVLTVYSAGPRIRRAVEALATPDVQTAACDDLDQAVGEAYRWARPDGVVLLSPAAASFDAFTDHAHRASTFRAAIDRLG